MGRILKVSVTKLGRIENLWQVWYNGKQRKALVVFQYGNEACNLPPKQFTRQEKSLGQVGESFGQGGISIHVSRRNTVRACYPQ